MIKLSDKYFDDLDTCLKSLAFTKYDLTSDYGKKFKDNLQSNGYQDFEYRLYMPKINAIWILESSERTKNPVICYHAQDGNRQNNTSLVVTPCKRLNEKLFIEQGASIENDSLHVKLQKAMLINLDTKTTIDKDVEWIKSNIQKHLTKLEEDKDLEINNIDNKENQINNKGQSTTNDNVDESENLDNTSQGKNHTDPVKDDKTKGKNHTDPVKDDKKLRNFVIIGVCALLACVAIAALIYCQILVSSAQILTSIAVATIVTVASCCANAFKGGDDSDKGKSST